MNTRAALSIWWALRTSPSRGPNPSVDRRVRWKCRAPGWQGAPDGQQAKNLVVTKCYKCQPGALRTSVSCLPVNAALATKLNHFQHMCAKQNGLLVIH